MEDAGSGELLETLKITEYAGKEAKEIISELDVQCERLVEIQKRTGETNGLLFTSKQLADSVRKSVAARWLLLSLVFFFAVLAFIFVRIEFY